MLPIPSDHYQICGKTSMCQLRCMDSFNLFYFELNNSQLKSPNVPPTSYAVSTESLFFNPYQSTSSSLYYVDQQIVALATRALASSRACSSCPTACLSIVKTPWVSSSSSTFTLISYCIPPADNLKATVYASGLDDWSFSAPAAVDTTMMTLTFCDLALQPDEIYVVLAYSSASMSIDQAGIMSTSSSSSTTTTTTKTVVQQLYVVWYDSQNTFQQPQQAISHLLLDTQDIAGVLMTNMIKNYVFEEMTSTTVSNVQVTQCSISNLVELATGTRGQLLFFFSVTFAAQGYYANNQLIQRASTINVIFKWQDPSSLSSMSSPVLQFFLPCKSTQNGIFVASIGCRPGLDTVLYLGQLGSFLFVESNIYLHIPSSNNMQTMPLQYVQVDPTGNSTQYLSAPPSALRYTQNDVGTYHLTMPMAPSPSQASRRR